MKQRNVILFIITFFASYFGLVLLYGLYLNATQVAADNVYQCDPITNAVAHQTIKVLELVHVEASLEQHTEELSVKLLVDAVFVARVIEGCNGISIIILFCSFVIAFPGNRKKALLFCLIGGIAIYSVNVLRIALLAVLLAKFPNQQEPLHNLMFPAIIYGFTFFLWVLWVTKYSKR